jgi:trans-aconitate methyltransferase
MRIEYVEVDVESKNEGDHRKKTFAHILKSMNLSVGRKVADLGAGPCIFARSAAQHGLEVTAVDARLERIPKAEEIAPVVFVESDVRDFSVEGYDLVLVFGLLYHLEIPDQLLLLERCRKAGATVIVDTQVHIPEFVCTPEPGRFTKVHKTDEGYEGVGFREAKNPMASVGNRISFWHTELSMYKLFENAGFALVETVEPPYQSKHGARRFYICRNER